MHDAGLKLDDLVEALSSPEAYAAPVGEVDVLQTHISVLFFAGSRVYKLKKPVQLDFLDYRDVDARRRFCEEEVRLNRRTSPDMYLGVRAVTEESDGRIAIDGRGEAVDWVVEMHRLPDDRMLDVLLDRGEVSEEQLDAVAAALARFHGRAVTGPSVNRYGLVDAIVRKGETNLEELADVAARHEGIATEPELDYLRRRTAAFPREDRALFERRVAEWRIREGHGDLHAGNVCLVDETPYVYDCVEFDRALRCADVASDLAFLTMDLDHRGHAEWATYLVQSYSESAGDRELVRLLPYYATYRALVRAKVELLTSEDDGLESAQRRAAEEEAVRYVQLALGYALPRCLVLVCGLPAAGKSAAARYVAGRLCASWLRGDRVGREASDDGNGRGEAHSLERRERVYRELLERATGALDARSVVVDATFSRRVFRRPFLDAAARLGVPCFLLEVEVPDEVAEERLARRDRRARSSGGGPSEADRDAWLEEQRHFEAPVEVPDGSHARVSGESAPEAQCRALQAAMIRAATGEPLSR